LIPFQLTFFSFVIVQDHKVLSETQLQWLIKLFSCMYDAGDGDGGVLPGVSQAPWSNLDQALI
jgi:hypothetical protein